jgi:release factor glutamine methyltransferase
MTIRSALLQGQKIFEQAGIVAPRLTAEVLLAHAAGCDRAWLYAHSDEELRELWWIHYGRYLHERLKGKPTQYITGHQEFYGRDFLVTPDVLIPRPETEHVIEAALQHARGKVLDIATGSGAIAVTISMEAALRVAATDLSENALRVARKNALRLGARVDFACCDLGSAFGGAAFDLVVCNPPYVPEMESLPREVRDYEPPLALFGGADGLAVYRRVVPEAARLLRPGGWLVMELGYRLREPVEEMLSEWSDVRVIPDLAGIPRVIAAMRGGSSARR